MTGRRQSVALTTARGSFGVRRLGRGGPLVVCVHGFPDDASSFDALADTLADTGFQTVSVYLRGYSPSPTTGSLALPDLVEDLLAVIDALSPEEPVLYVGHDYGAQLGYPLLARVPHRVSAAVLLSGAHPGRIRRAARSNPRQLWMSRYIIVFQFGRLADWWVARRRFAYIDQLWRRWSPGFTVPADHAHRVKETLTASMPAPVAMYRGGGFDVPQTPIDVPTLLITGTDDGCALPQLADGQGELFTRAYEEQVWAGTGHYPHWEHPGRAAETITAWFCQHGGTRAEG